MISLLIFVAIFVFGLYLMRDKTDWEYYPDQRVDKNDPSRVQVWDESMADDWISGMWVDK